MKPTLYAHPFSSYCWKVLIALYDTGIEFDYAMLDAEHPEHFGALTARWPFGKFPLLIDDGEAIPEASLIVEHLATTRCEAAYLLPGDAAQAHEVRLIDRVFDNYVMTPMQRFVGDAMRENDQKDPTGVAQAAALLDTAYGLLDERLAGRAWAVGDAFTLADCAGAPSLFYADWVHPIPDEHRVLRAYRARVLAHASVTRAVDEARPYRAFFPPGAPERD